MVNLSSLQLGRKTLKKEVDEVEAAIDEIDKEIGKIDWSFGDSHITRQQSNDHFIELMQAVTRKPKDTTMISHIPTPKRPVNKKEALMGSLQGFGTEWIDDTFKPIPEAPVLPMTGLWLALVWVKYHWNRLIGNDIRADFLNGFLEDFRHNKEEIKDRLTAIKISQLRVRNTKVQQRLFGPQMMVRFKKDYWAFDRIKPAIDHIVMKAILDYDFTHPLLEGVFEESKSTRERVACFKMLAYYWLDVDYIYKKKVIEKILSNYQNATPVVKQEVDDLLAIIDTVYNH